MSEFNAYYWIFFAPHMLFPFVCLAYILYNIDGFHHVNCINICFIYIYIISLLCLPHTNFDIHFIYAYFLVLLLLKIIFLYLSLNLKFFYFFIFLKKYQVGPCLGTENLVSWNKFFFPQKCFNGKLVLTFVHLYILVSLFAPSCQHALLLLK